MTLWQITVLGFLAGTIGTGLGGLTAVILTHVTPGKMSTLLGFSAGIMLAVVSFELMPQALNAGMATGIFGLLMGAILMASIDLLLPHWHLLGQQEQSRYLRVGVILGLGIAMHNFPEGLAIGGGSTQGTALGYALAAVIMIQNIPEGMAVALPLNMGKVKNSRVLLTTVAVGIPMGFGAWFGGFTGRISPEFLSLALSFAAGAMLFITCDEMIPEAENLSQGHSATFGIVAGVITGILVTYALTV